MQFRDFLGNAHGPVGTQGRQDFGRKFVDAMAALVEREGVVEIPILLEKREPGGLLGRQETDKEKAIGGQARRAQDRGQRAGARDGYYRQPAAAAGAD